MKKLALQVAAISFAFAGTAAAADLRPAPVKAPLAPVAVAYNWTGCYVGGGGGYGMWNQHTQYVAAGAPFGLANDNGGRGWFGTVQVGCDYQVGSNIVIGAFGDYDFSGIKGNMITGAVGLTGQEKLRNSWAAGGRIGWVPWATTQLLVYVSGGYTQARFNQVALTSTLGGPVLNTLPRTTYDGWFIGSGYEYGMSFLPGLFWKTEYRFADYGKESLQVFTAAGAPVAGQFVEAHKYVHTVRSELVWRFNFGGPVVARY